MDLKFHGRSDLAYRALDCRADVGVLRQRVTARAAAGRLKTASRLSAFSKRCSVATVKSERCERARRITAELFPNPLKRVPMDDLTSILVHLNASAGATQRLHVACLLAAAQGAQIEMLYAGAPSLLLNPLVASADSALAAMLASIDVKARQRVHAVFALDTGRGQPARSAMAIDG